MRKGSSTVHPASRFDQLTPDQENAYRGKDSSPLLSGKLRSFTGKKSLLPFFEAAVMGFASDVADFHDAIAVTDGFVLMCNARRELRSNRAYQGIRTSLSCGILAFARASGLNTKPLCAWPANLGSKFRDWLREEALNSKGEVLSPNTARRYYGEFCSLFAELGERAKTANGLPKFEPFPNNPFSRAQDATRKTKSLGLTILIAILHAARAEFREVVQKVRHAQHLFKGPEVPPDLSKRSKLRYQNIDALLWHLRKKCPENFPTYTSWRQTDGPLFEAINKLHGGWGRVGEYFQPFAQSCVAPLLLLTIYGHFNVEPLRALRRKQVRRIEVLRNEHIEVRMAVQPGKNRGAPYRRSFPVDDLDFASPSSILSFMMEWTHTIRNRAGIYSDCVFIFMTQEGEVKAFATATLEGRSGDSKWIHHLKQFCKRHNLPNFNLRELRQTSLDFARLISDEDIREISALKGGSSASVLEFHYRSDAAESRAQATVGELQANKERYVRSAGKSHHLGAQRKDISAATPGCSCADPYDSPIPGEVSGALCGAFGCCPACPHGSPLLGSAHALARLLQLRAALLDAKLNIPLERWIARYKRPLDVLEGSWLPLFDDPQLWEHVKRMSLQPIGVIE